MRPEAYIVLSRTSTSDRTIARLRALLASINDWLGNEEGLLIEDVVQWRDQLEAALADTERPEEVRGPCCEGKPDGYECNCPCHVGASKELMVGPAYQPKPSVLSEIHSPFCPDCGATMCTHHPFPTEEDVPLQIRRELLACASNKGISYYWLCAVYREGVRAERPEPQEQK